MTAPSDGRVLVTVEGGVGRVVLDRPRMKNALSRAMCLDLVEAFTRLDADPEVAVVTIAGSGGNFCAGAGLDQFDEVLFDGASADGASFVGASFDGASFVGASADGGFGGGSVARGDGVDRLSQADAALSAVRKPTIALVEGICMGGGWQLASAADVVMASSDVRIAITPSKLGIIYPRAGLERLAERAGPDRAKYLLLSAAEVTPEQADQWNLVTVLLDAETFDVESAAAVAGIQSRSLFSHVSHKRLLNGFTDTKKGPGHASEAAQSRSDYARDWARTWGEFRTGADLAEGRRAFAAKERPVFPWRLDDAAVL